MGRWAQAQRRGTAVAAVAPTPAPVFDSVTYLVDGDNLLQFDSANDVPAGINWFFWQIAAVAAPGAILGDGDDSLVNLTDHPGFPVSPSGTYEYRIAWGVTGVIATAYGPWVVVTF